MMQAPIRGRDGEAALCRALIASAAAAGCMLTIDRCATRRWASATFSGAQHGVQSSTSSTSAAAAWIAALPQAELALRHGYSADLVVDVVEDDGTTLRIALTALTIAEG